MRGFLGLLLLPMLLQGPAQAQEEDFDIPPPPPIIDDYEEPMIEPMEDEIPDIPMDADMVDGPIYDAPPEDDSAPSFDPNSDNPQPNNPGRFGFSRDPRPPSLRGNNRPATGNSAFGEAKGDVKFEVVEGVFWEKGKKRTRGERE